MLNNTTKGSKHNTMKVKIHSSELSRMMKAVLPCTDQRDLTNRANIMIRSTCNALYIRGTNGVMSADMCTPILGGEDESFCVDGQTFAKVIGATSGEVEISTDSKACIIKGAGRTRLPVVNANLPEGKHALIDGTMRQTFVKAGDFVRCFGNVAYAVSADQTTRPVLSGVLVEVERETLQMTGLDGFQMSVDRAPCHGADTLSAIVPGAFLKLVSQTVGPEDDVSLSVNGNVITAGTDGMMLSCVLLSGQFPDVKRIMPDSFKIECLTDGGELMNALKSGSVVNSKQNLVKLDISADSIRITNNGDNAEYEADVPCMTTGIENGETFRIAFNQKYLMNAVNAVSDDDVVLHFNSSVSPCVARKKSDVFGSRLLLPVRLTQQG